MNNLKNNILEKIKKGDVQKEPKWHFLTKKYFLWSSAVLSITLGGISFAILLKNYFDDFGPWYKMRLENSFFLSNILYLWIFSFLIFLGIAYLNYINTKNAFRYKKLYVILGSLGISFLLGLVFYFSHIGHFIDKSLERHFHQYWNLKQEKKEFLIRELYKNNIDFDEFFRNKKVLKKKEKYDKIDEDRIRRIKEVLENSRGDKDKIEKEKEILEKIKEKKKELDKKRIQELIEIYLNN